jgi:hypothetical protein
MNPMFSELAQKLEVERNDLSYKTPSPQKIVTVEVPVKQSLKDREARDKKFFHAGRYSMGARDRIATAAMEWVDKHG